MSVDPTMMCLSHPTAISTVLLYRSRQDRIGGRFLHDSKDRSLTPRRQSSRWATAVISDIFPFASPPTGYLSSSGKKTASS
ncbi:hypothetical protein FOPG_18176 [Fusarium oxysporum f. sp. conglutinans race 2 54008]|uniref:Uncharacterized protein n=1 Tax=Fusarium oxysporum f. sp. conglutinans race 2 54008 TaxID=1089457 RepID=X0GQK1_FUSOX|nr:hypothetical protein FOPG_18176 [Fusarium oxysporum f. sp. conglutinans race 2 54008]